MELLTTCRNSLLPEPPPVPHYDAVPQEVGALNFDNSTNHNWDSLRTRYDGVPVPSRSDIDEYKGDIVV